MASLRRSKQLSPDNQTARFLYTILKQLDLKPVDWTEVAASLDITNGHAARMRYSRFKQQIEGLPPQPRTSKGKKRNGKTATLKGKGKHEGYFESLKREDTDGEDRMEVDISKIKLETPSTLPYGNVLNNEHAYIKAEPSTTTSERFTTSNRPLFWEPSRITSFTPINPTQLKAEASKFENEVNLGVPTSTTVSMADLELPLRSKSEDHVSFSTALADCGHAFVIPNTPQPYDFGLSAMKFEA